MLGEDATSYCLGYVKGSEAETKAAAQKLQDGTAWKLTKVALDGRAEAAYLNTPIKMRNSPTNIYVTQGISYKGYLSTCEGTSR